MKGASTFIIIAIALFVTLNACCSKADNCSSTDIVTIDLVNFTGNEADSVLIIPFKKNSGFTIHGDTLYTTAVSAGSGSIIHHVTSSECDLNNDYRVYIVKTHKAYDIYGYEKEKKNCSKCFMKTNNQYSEVLVSYKINAQSLQYDGSFKIIK